MPREGPFFYFVKKGPLRVRVPGLASLAQDDKNHSNPVGTFLFSEVSFIPAPSAIVSISAAKSLFR